MNNNMTVYYKCNLKLYQHMISYIIASIGFGIVAYLFYHLLPVAVILGLIVGIYIERLYAKSTIKKRQKSLRKQFRDFLDGMSVAVRAGNVEIKAIQSTLRDLEISYSPKSDIVKEVKNILFQYEKGGAQLKTLFLDFGERSGLEDIKNFATIYSVIEGKSDRFGDIITQTAQIIGEKVEIEQEITTTISSAKSETNMMIVLPIIMVIMLYIMGGGLLDVLFTTTTGHIVATISLAIFTISYIIALKVSDIKM